MAAGSRDSSVASIAERMQNMHVEFNDDAESGGADIIGSQSFDKCIICQSHRVSRMQPPRHCKTCVESKVCAHCADEYDAKWGKTCSVCKGPTMLRSADSFDLTQQRKRELRGYYDLELDITREMRMMQDGPLNEALSMFF